MPGRDVLRDGGNAVEAMIAMAAAIPVVYPHMNAHRRRQFLDRQASPGRIQSASMPAAPWRRKPTDALYRDAGFDAIPSRGPLAANTVAGTLSGWQAALAVAASLGGEMSRERLLEAAIHHAEKGFPATGNQSRTTTAKLAELKGLPGYDEAFLLNGIVPEEGDLFRQERLGATLRRLAADGFGSFYTGALAQILPPIWRAPGHPYRRMTWPPIKR